MTDALEAKKKQLLEQKQKPVETAQPPNSTEGKGAIAQPETPRPDPATADYDNWLNTEAEKLKGEKISYDLAVKGGVESVKGTNYGGLGVNKSIDKLTDKSSPKYSVTHLASGRKVGDFDDEEMAKKAVVELQKMGVDWQTKDLTKSSDKLANLHKTLNDVAVSHWRVLRERANKQDISTPEPQKKAEAIAKTPKTPEPKAVKIEDNSPPRPKLKSKENMVNLLYDDWLETESQKNQGRDAQYQVKFPSGDVSVQGRIYGNFGVHEDRTGKTPMYNITHLASGRALNRLENEDQARKAIIELNRSGIDWSLNEAELMKDPKMQGKMKTAKKLMDIAVESDRRVKVRNSVGEKLAQEKMARDEEARKPKVIPTDAEYQANLLKHLETKIFDLNLNDERYKNALISRVTQEVKNRMNTDPDSYLANPYSLNALVAAYLADKPEPPKFEDYVKSDLSPDKGVKKLATEAFWYFKDKKLTSNSTPDSQKKTKLIGDGTHSGVPKNAKEYYDAMIAKGEDITERQAEYTMIAIKDWTKSSYRYIRQNQKQGIQSDEADRIERFVKNSTPFKGQIYRGMSFDSEADAMKWAKESTGGIIEQDALSSWTSKEDVGKRFAYQNSYLRQAVLLKSVNNKTGASIRKLSKQLEENEVIVPKGAKHKVRSVTKKDDLIIVEVEEI